MSEPLRLAKTAREHLASALRALQSDDNVPDELMEVADPIAEAMSALHRIERSGGAALEGREVALQKVRAALDLLIALKVSHPAVDLVTDAVALSISKAAGLVRFVPHAGGAVAAVPAAVVEDGSGPTTKRPGPNEAALGTTPPPQPVVAAPAPVPAPTPQPVAPAPLPAPQPVVAAPAPVAAPPPQPVVVAPAPVAAPAPQPVVQAARPASQPAPAPAPVSASASVPVPAPVPAPAPDAGGRPPPPIQPPPGAPTIDVEMGTHSASNFYKGLGGHDVVEHGGIFVATYRPQKIGAPVHIRVLLPGNYEFLANAVVTWTRASGVSNDSAAPGFGARITQIHPEGRQLIHRYARNREPIFYDDL